MSEDRIKVKSLFCTRALFCNFQDSSMRKEPFLRPHYGRSKHAWHWWLCVGLGVLQDPMGAPHWSQRGDEAVLAPSGAGGGRDEEPRGWLPRLEVLCCWGIPGPSPPCFSACPCLLAVLAESSGFIDLFVSSCRALQDQPRATGKLRERRQRRRAASSLKVRLSSRRRRRLCQNVK